MDSAQLLLARRYGFPSWNPPDPPRATAGRATGLLFRTALGTSAGVVDPDVPTLSPERPTDRFARETAVLADGIFVLANCFTVTDAGLVLRVDNSRTADIVPTAALPDRVGSITPTGASFVVLVATWRRPRAC